MGTDFLDSHRGIPIPLQVCSPPGSLEVGGEISPSYRSVVSLSNPHQLVHIYLVSYSSDSCLDGVYCTERTI